MGHQSTTQRVQGSVTVILGFAIAFATIGSNKGVDTVTLYSFSHAIPDVKALETAYTATPTAASLDIALKAQKALAKDCLYTLYGNQDYRSPACNCAFDVISKYGTQENKIKDLSGWHNATLEERYKAANQALRACFDSQPSVPETVFMWKDKYNVNDINSRKVVSRGGLVLLITLSLVFTLVYNSIDFANTTSIMVVNGVLLLIAVLQIVLPAVGTQNITGIMGFFAILVLPSFAIEFVFTEYVWSYIYQRHRTSYVHPYVFVTILQALFIMAAIENGVFSWSEIFSRILSAHALALAYAASIFFVHFACGDWAEMEKSKEDSEKRTLGPYKQVSEFSDVSIVDSHTLAGQFILALAVASIAVVNIIPLYPTAPELNMMWLAPWVYVFIVFGTVLLMQHMTKGADDAEKRLRSLSYWGSLASTILILSVVLFYLLRYLHLGFGETVREDGDLAFNTVLYALKKRDAAFPMGAATPMYVVP